MITAHKPETALVSVSGNDFRFNNNNLKLRGQWLIRIISIYRISPLWQFNIELLLSCVFSASYVTVQGTLINHLSLIICEFVNFYYIFLI